MTSPLINNTEMTTEELESDLWYENLLWKNTVVKVGIINHPKHGLYYIWYENGLYGISMDDNPTHCGYASISALFSTKGI